MTNYKLTKIEQETIITYNRKENFVDFSTRIKKDKTKLNRLGYKPVIDDDGYSSYKIPINEFAWGKKRKMSSEQKKKSSERMKKLNMLKNKEKKVEI